MKGRFPGLNRLLWIFNKYSDSDTNDWIVTVSLRMRNDLSFLNSSRRVFCLVLIVDVISCQAHVRSPSCGQEKWQMQHSHSGHSSHDGDAVVIQAPSNIWSN